jgi:uncharacterized protein with GYD domain
MSTYMLLCNFTDQGVRTIKDAPKRRAAARELGKNEVMAQFLLSVASKGNVRTTTVRVFPEAEFDKIVAAALV